MEDEQNPAINEPVEQPTEVEAPATESHSQESEGSPEVTEAAAEIAETRQPSRAERRIRELSARNREMQQQAQPPQPQQPWQQQAPLPYQTPPRMPRYEPGAEVSPEQLERDVAQTADGIAQLRVQQALAQYDQRMQTQQRQAQFESDISHVEGKYGELNPDSDKFDSRLSSRITSLYEKAAANNPSLRLQDFVEEAMDLAGVGADRSKAEVRAKLTQQAASAAVTPGTTKPPAVDLTKMRPADRAKYIEKKQGFRA